MRPERHDRFDVLRDEWDALADRVGAVPWIRPGWIEPWHEAFGRGQPELVALRDEGGRLRALAPLERRGGVLAAPTNWHTPEYELLAADAESRRELAAALVASGARRVQVSFMPRTGGGLEELAAAARGRRWRLLERVVERSPSIPIETDWESFRGTLARGFAKELTRRRRRLGELGELTFELDHGREGLDELLQDGFRVEASGWKGQSGTAILSRPETRAFYAAIARWAASKDWLRLGCLRLDGRLIAFELNIAANGALYVLKGGYDEEFRKFGPGTLVVEDVIRSAFEAGLQSYEFLGSDDAYKLDWTTTLRDRMMLQAFSLSLAGLVDHAAYAVGRPLAKKALALRRRG